MIVDSSTKPKLYLHYIINFCHRDHKGWNTTESLLMDGGYKNPRMNLRKEIFWPDNIVKVIYCSLILVHSDPILQLFKKYNVRKKFDLLSVDSDNNDFFMLEAILKAGYRPRVII